MGEAFVSVEDQAEEVEYWTTEEEDGSLKTAVVYVPANGLVPVDIDMLRELFTRAGFTWSDTPLEVSGA